MEQYYEQNVVNHNIEDRIKRTKLLSFLQMAFITIAVFSLMSCAFLLFVGSQYLLLLLTLMLSVAVPCGIAAFIIGRVNKKNNVEYDYTIDNEYLCITAVYFRQQRKQLHKILLRTIESVGVFDSEGYKKNEGKADKKQLAIVNFDDEDAIMYILYVTEKDRRLLFIEPDRGFIIALKRVVSAINVFDKSVADLEKKLDGSAASK